MAKFKGGLDHSSVHVHPSQGHAYTGGSDITDDANSVNCFGSDTSDDNFMDSANHLGSDSSDDMDSPNHIPSNTGNHLEMGNHVGLGNLNDTGTKNPKNSEILNDVCADTPVDSGIRETDSTLESNEVGKKKSSTAFTIDFGSDSSSGGLSISDKLSRYLPRHVAQRVEQRASNVKVRSDRGKASNKESLLSRSEKSLPGVQVHRSREETKGKPDRQKSLPIVNLRAAATPFQHKPSTAKKKPTKEGGRRTSFTLHSAPSCASARSFRTPCRQFSSPSNQNSSRSTQSAKSCCLTSPRSVDLSISDSVDCIESSKTGSVRGNHSYTILRTTEDKRSEDSDTISDAGTYDKDSVEGDDIQKVRQAMSHMFGARNGATVKSKGLAQFTRSGTRQQSPVRKPTTGLRSFVRSGVRTCPSSAETSKSRTRCLVKGKGAQFGDSKVGNSAETLRRISSSSQSKKNIAAITQVLQPQKVNCVSPGGKETRPNSRNALTADHSLKYRLCDFGVSASDHAVNSSSSKVPAVAVQRSSPLFEPRLNRAHKLRCARMEASASAGRNADRMSLLKTVRRRVPKLSADGTPETSSHTSICSRESGNSSVCALRGVKQNARLSCCSLLQDEVLSPVDSLMNVAVDRSHTSLDATQGKRSHVRKTSSLLTYSFPRARERETSKPQDRFALNLPEVRAWHERHQHDRTKTAPAKLLPGRMEQGQVTLAGAKYEQDRRNLVRNNSSATMADTGRNLFNVSPVKNGNNYLQALKTLQRTSEEIAVELRKINESHVRGVILPLAQQQLVIHAINSALRNCSEMQKDIQEIRKVL